MSTASIVGVKSKAARKSTSVSSESDTCPEAELGLSTNVGRLERPRWLKAEELHAATESYLADQPNLKALDERELKLLTKRLLREEIAFITNNEFQEAGAGEKIFAESLGLDPADPVAGIAALKKTRVADLPIHLGRLCEAKLLTPEQERALFQRMNFLRHQAALHRSRLNPEKPSKPRIELVQRLLALADWHRDAIVQANMRLVFSIVKKFVNKSNAFDDLLSDGIVALIRAVEKFDFDRGFRFSTYATQVVRRNAYRTVVLKQKEKSKMVGGLQELGLDISDEERQPAISEHRWHELRSRLSVMLGELDRREKFIIRARFSLGSHRKVHTLQALADRLGVSKERVRQLEKRALDKLRMMAGEVKLAELET